MLGNIISLLFLLGTNLYPFFFPENFGPNSYGVLLAYWAEALIVAFFVAIKIGYLKTDANGLIISNPNAFGKNRENQTPRALRKQVLIFATFFSVGQLLFLLLIISSRVEIQSIFSLIKLALPLAGMFIVSHAVSFFVNFLNNKEYENATADQLFNTYVVRMAPMHVAIIIGAAVNAPLKVFLIAKTLFDTFMHLIEHHTLKRSISRRSVDVLGISLLQQKSNTVNDPETKARIEKDIEALKLDLQNISENKP